MSTDHNDLSSPFTLDRMRFMAMRVWSSTLERTYDVDLDILELASEEARRRYQDLAERSALPLSFAEEAETIEAWAIWQALACQVARRQRIPVGASGICIFAKDLEKVLERLKTRVTEGMFIL
jgi:hypothetical protein